MTRYLLSVYQPDGPPPESLDMDKIMHELGALRQEMRDAGQWVFSTGLQPASTATVVRARDGDVVMTDGPYVEGKEHLGGFTIVEADDLDQALAWAGRIATITTLPTEVRPAHPEPQP